MKKNICISIIIILILVGVSFLLFLNNDKTNNISGNDSGSDVGSIGPCKEYLDIFKSVENSLNPKECKTIDNNYCMNSCFANYARVSLDKEYCKYDINPNNSRDVSNIESCYVNIAMSNKDSSVCDDINFDLNGFGYIGYKENKKKYIGYYLDNTDIEFLAEINPKTYCYYNSIDKSNYENCNDVNFYDKLKDVCYFDSITYDISNPKYTGGLPFSCNELKTDEGKSFCESLKLDVTKLRKQGLSR